MFQSCWSLTSLRKLAGSPSSCVEEEALAFEGRMWVLPCLARLCRQVGVGGGGGGGRAHGGLLGRRCSRRPSGWSWSSSAASLPFAPSSLFSFSLCSTWLPGCLNRPPGFRRGLQSQQPGIHSLPPYHFDLKIIWAKKRKRRRCTTSPSNGPRSTVTRWWRKELDPRPVRSKLGSLLVERQNLLSHWLTPVCKELQLLYISWSRLRMVNA